MIATEEKSAWHEARERANSNADRDAARRAALWVQGQRIEAYLPRLYEQHQEAAQRLRELDELIRDEEDEAARIRATVK